MNASFGSVRQVFFLFSGGAQLTVRFGLEFPERPGALGNFLKGMKVEWNISMFHYRNHGAGTSPSLLYFLSISFTTLILVWGVADM